MNKGLPHYVAIKRKPESGCEIHSMGCGKSGIMMGLRLVKREETDGSEELNHGVRVMKKLLEGWSPRNRVVCADSYFASVQAAIEMWKDGWRFIGVVKTAHKGYPKDFLGSVQLAKRGECAGLTTTFSYDGKDFQLMACVYCDRDRHYFISTCSNLNPGEAIERTRWRQVSEVEEDEDPDLVYFEVNVPQVAELYYDTCGAVDQHNRHRQSTLNLEKKLQTKDWSRRVNMSIFGIIVVDSWLMYNGCIGGHAMTQKEFYKTLATELIDNDFGVGVRSRRSSADSSSDGSSVGTAGRGLHLTPTKKKVPGGTNGRTTFSQQRCRICGKKTIMRCAVCCGQEELGDLRSGFCCPTTGRPCFEFHMDQTH